MATFFSCAAIGVFLAAAASDVARRTIPNELVTLLAILGLGRVVCGVVAGDGMADAGLDLAATLAIFALGAPLRSPLDAFDDGHGRLVRRRVFACADLAPFATLRDWPGLATVVAVETIRGIPGRGKVRAEIRHYLSSTRLPPEALAAAIRNHWRIENGLHWVLDVTFREDASRVRERNAARNLALLRKIALNLARADTTVKASLKGKRKYASWDDAFMATLIAG